MAKYSKYFDKTKKPFDSTFSPARFSQNRETKEIESQWLETKAHREKWEKIAERQRKWGCADFIIEDSERVAKLTHWEYRLECLENERQYNEMRNDYVKNNPMQESVVEEIYRRFDKLMEVPKREFKDSNLDTLLKVFDNAMDSRDIIPYYKDWQLVYSPLIHSLNQQFLEKYGKHIDMEKAKKELRD